MCLIRSLLARVRRRRLRSKYNLATMSNTDIDELFDLKRE